MKTLSLTTSLVLLAEAISATEPREVQWHGTPIGPDGPWNAVKVRIGSQQLPVALFPGRSWLTWVSTTEYCTFSRKYDVNNCPGGAYHKKKPTQEVSSIRYHSSPQDLMKGVQIKGDDAIMFQDDFEISPGSGLVIPNVSMSLLESSQVMVYPGESQYPIFAGCLSLGAQEATQNFDLVGDLLGQSLSSNIIPWYLSKNNFTASSSFGLHLGSAVDGFNVSGSLLFGGYDQSRVVGKVLEMDGNSFSSDVRLQDISLGVIQGKSPFGFDAKNGLLAGRNTTLNNGKGIFVQLDPCSPYLTLPEATCEAIACHLPVSYDKPLGLYLWNTSDSMYADIMASASVLSFTLGSSSDSLTINVPLQHLNLKLEPPIKETPTPYLPCSTGGLGSYVLGRAFLQDAFLGGSWEQQRWWLAQAPGPGSRAPSKHVDILPQGRHINSGVSNWASTWDGVWTELARRSRSSLTSSSGNPSGDNVSLTVGDIVGGVVGGGCGLFVLMMTFIIIWKRHGHQQQTSRTTMVQKSRPGQTPAQMARLVEADGRAARYTWSSLGHLRPMMTPRNGTQTAQIHELDHGIPKIHR
ncbi:hypothetical protein CDD80_6898 [Ophiocordyceps camponoti-rufipedis]|uniref:Peptidase A1 domain-containing protein n=1 Tax=Ophiocordyceps camponoti-rufipedis TaxID=2004952 RepID=A0A2C5YRU9_9HYPO|nr:hypothetical protein CDD80_6898 [Ophiocordyceps camponoti-rufipedis]